MRPVRDLTSRFIKKEKPALIHTASTKKKADKNKQIVADFKALLQRGDCQTIVEFIKRTPIHVRWDLIFSLVETYVGIIRSGNNKEVQNFLSKSEDSFCKEEQRRQYTQHKIRSRSNSQGQTLSESNESIPESSSSLSKDSLKSIFERTINKLKDPLFDILSNASNEDFLQEMLTNYVTQITTIWEEKESKLKGAILIKQEKIKQLLKSQQKYELQKRQMSIRIAKLQKELTAAQQKIPLYTKLNDTFEEVSQFMANENEERDKKFRLKNMIEKFSKKIQEQSDANRESEIIPQFSIKKIKSVSPIIQQKQQHQPLFSNSIFMSQSKIFRQFFSSKKISPKIQLIEGIFDEIESFQMKKIIRVNLLFIFDHKTSENNPLRLIEKLPNILLIAKIQQNQRIIGCFSDNGICAHTFSRGFLFAVDLTCTNRKQLKTFKISQKFSDKSVSSYDPYYLKFGNSQIRIKLGTRQVYSSFGLESSYFKQNQQMKVHDFLNCNELREVQLETYELYHVQMRNRQT